MVTCIVCLMGLPASGKTSFASALKKHFSCEPFKFEVVVINFDNEVEFSKPEMVSWKDKRKKVANLVQEILGIYSEGTRLVILDDNMYYKSMRYQYYQLARKFSAHFCQIYLEVPYEEAKERNKMRSSKVPEDIIIKMSQRIEPPDEPWEKISVTLLPFDLNNMPSIVEDLVLKALAIPILELKAPSEKDIHVCNSLHEADLATRAIVRNIISTSPSPELASVLSLRRRNIMADIRLGKIMLPHTSSEEKRDIYYKFLLPFMMD